MKGIIIPLTEEEFQQQITEAIIRAMATFAPAKTETEYMSRNETAAKLSITLPTLNEYTKAGRIKGYKIGRRVLYRKDEVEAALIAIEPLKYRR